MTDDAYRALAHELERWPEEQHSELIEGFRQELAHRRELSRAQAIPRTRARIERARRKRGGSQKEWLHDNQAAMDDANRHIEQHGLPLSDARRKATSEELEAQADRAIATPMRIQSLLNDAEPAKWEMIGGGAFMACPAPNTTLMVGPSNSTGWFWRVDSPEQHAGGTAPDPARAVACAEAVYHLTGGR